MISENIKYSFNQFETALIAFTANIQLKLQNIIPNLPVFFQNTGDFSYMVDKKFVKTNNEEIINKVPRFVLKLEDIQLNSQEDTNQYNKIVYTFDSNDGRGPINYQTVVRRKAFNVQLIGNFVSSNLITALNHLEVLAVFMSRQNVFTYEFLGNTIQGAYTITTGNPELPNIDMGQGSTRNVSISAQIELQTHLLVPRIDKIIELDKTGFDKISIELETKGTSDNDEEIKVEDYEETINHKYEDLKNEENEVSPKLEYTGGKIIPKDVKYK